jgi:hypothetical protein
MITLIARSTIHGFKNLVPGLVRAMEKTDIGSFWDLDSIYGLIVNEQAFGFLQHESGYGGVFTINNTPKARTLYHFWGGKPSDNPVAPDWEELDAFLVSAAKVFECTHIQCEGRKGWKPLLAPLGYVEDSVTYMKEVQHESVPIQSASEDGS